MKEGVWNEFTVKHLKWTIVDLLLLLISPNWEWRFPSLPSHGGTGLIMLIFILTVEMKSMY